MIKPNSNILFQKSKIYRNIVAQSTVQLCHQLNPKNIDTSYAQQFFFDKRMNVDIFWTNRSKLARYVVQFIQCEQKSIITFENNHNLR